MTILRKCIRWAIARLVGRECDTLICENPEVTPRHAWTATPKDRKVYVNRRAEINDESMLGIVDQVNDDGTCWVRLGSYATRMDLDELMADDDS